MSQFLITTSEISTWDLSKDLVLLGEWCNSYNSNFSKKFIVAKPYGISIAQRKKDLELIHQIYNTFFPQLTKILNNYHKKNYSDRYWKILIGHWFIKFIEITVNRHNNILECIKNHKIKETIFFRGDAFDLSCANRYELETLCNNNFWNNIFYKEIFRCYKNFGIKIKLNFYKERPIHHENSASLNIKKNARKMINFVQGMLSRNDEILIINPYLSRLDEVKLHLLLGQIPKIWLTNPLFQKRDIKKSLRLKLEKKLKINNSIGIHRLFKNLIFKAIPSCYLENYADLEMACENLNWPKNPKAIFTSNNFIFDEIFKIYTAKCVESECKYIVGQHGSSYGSHIYYRTNEEETSDKFLTWGWNDKNRNTVPMFNFKRKPYNLVNKKNGNLLIVFEPKNFRSNTWDTEYIFSNNWNSQLSLINSLGSEIKKKTVLRLHKGSLNVNWNDWNDVDRLKDNDPNIKIDLGRYPVEKILARSRIAIICYDSTMIMELISHNFPFIIFLPGGFDHLKPAVKKDYKVLYDHGLIYTDYKALSNRIKFLWNNFDNWWNSRKVKKAINSFKEKYCKDPVNKLTELKKAIND
jgi:putative transferase (TIGR04331 family)